MTSSDWIRGVLSWLATYAVHSTLFLGVALVLAAFRRPRVNRDRERLWKLALVGGVLTATLQCGLGTRAPFGHIEWRDSARTDALSGHQAGARPRSRESLATPPGPEAAPARSDPVTDAPRDPLTEIHAEPEILSATLAAQGRVPRAGEEPGPTREASGTHPIPRQGPADRAPSMPPTNDAPRLADALRSRWPSWVLGAWTAAGLLGLVGFGLSWTALRRHLLGRELLRGGPLVESLERLRVRAGMHRRVRVSVSARIRSPFSTGWFRPEICLPRAVSSALTPAQQEVLLAHELAHLVRRDPAWFALGLLFERVFFFQPMNRLARRHLSELAEVACDDWAVRWTGARLALASCLTEVAGWVVGEQPRPLALPGLAGSPSRLGRRIERLLDDRRSPAGEPPTPWWPPIAASALTLVVLAGPGVSSPRPRIGAGSRAERPATPPAAAPARASRTAPVTATLGRPGTAPTLTPLTEDLANQRELEAELAELESELRALRDELEARDLDRRFRDTLAELGERLHALRAQHARVQALLERLAVPQPPAGGQQPPVAGPAPTDLPGEPR